MDDGTGQGKPDIEVEDSDVVVDAAAAGVDEDSAAGRIVDKHLQDSLAAADGQRRSMKARSGGKEMKRDGRVERQKACDQCCDRVALALGHALAFAGSRFAAAELADSKCEADVRAGKRVEARIQERVQAMTPPVRPRGGARLREPEAPVELEAMTPPPLSSPPSPPSPQLLPLP